MPSLVSAETVHIDSATISKGYTVVDQTGSVKIGVFPDSVSSPIDIAFKQKDELISQLNPPQGMKLISPFYEFDIKSDQPLKLHRPLVLQLNYSSDSFFKKHVYFWDARRESWIEVSAWDYRDEGFVRSHIYLSYAIVAVFEEVVANKTVFVDQTAIEKGYTVEHRNGELKVGVVPNSISQPVRVSLKSQSAMDPMPEVDLISNIYSFDILSDYLVEVTKPINVSLKYFQDQGGTKVVKYWDSQHNTWRDLPTTVDETSKIARAQIQLPYARLAVFEDIRDIKVGVASYFRANDPSGCAYLDHPFGTRLKVTNLENNKTTIVKVEDRGPFIPGRVIDLSIESFQELAPLSQGLIRVKVEKID